MAFNITEITSAINGNGGLSRTSHFVVRITPPARLVRHEYARMAYFFCDAVSLPGLRFATEPVKISGYGLSEERPSNAEYDPLQCTFMVDNDSRVYDFFHSWMAAINNFNIDVTNTSQGPNLGYGEFAYPGEYEGTMEIISYDPAGETVITYTVNRVFPKIIGDIGMRWEDNDTITRMPVLFAYKNWSAQTLPAGTSRGITADGTQFRQDGGTSTSQALRLNPSIALQYGVNLLANRNLSAIIQATSVYARAFI